MRGLGFGDRPAGFSRFDNVDALGRDIDVALGRDDVAADLTVGVAGANADVAVNAADRALGGSGDIKASACKRSRTGIFSMPCLRLPAMAAF